MYKIIVAIIGGIFLLISAWIGKAEEPSLNKASSPPKIALEVEGKIINFGNNNTITNIETQINNK